MRRSLSAGRLALALAAAAALSALAAGSASADPAPAGFVFTSTNDAGGNSVLVYQRAANGTLTAAGSAATGGLGTGAGLGSQGALALSRDDGRYLFVVNAGSNSISAFTVRRSGLSLLGTVPSGGVDPISLTVDDDLLYVLNAGDASSPANISGFRLHEGRLSPISGSTQPLSADSVGPAQISFDTTGRLLVVTEKATNLIDTYRVGPGGRAHKPHSQTSAGQTPFGFAFDRDNRLIVSEAFGGAAGAGAMSSYRVTPGGQLHLITGSAGDNQAAPCWVVTTRNGRYAYTTNTGSGTISSYRIGNDGSLTLLASVAATTGGAPIDMALDRTSRYLYAISSGTISGFAVANDGSLAPIGGNPSGLPASSVGLVAF